MEDEEKEQQEEGLCAKYLHATGPREQEHSAEREDGEQPLPCKQPPHHPIPTLQQQHGASTSMAKEAMERRLLSKKKGWMDGWMERSECGPSTTDETNYRNK